MKEAIVKYVLVTAVCCCALSACTPRNLVRHRLETAEAMLSENPDSAWSILKGMNPSVFRGAALRARWALLCSEAMDKCSMNADDDSLIRIAVRYYAKRGDELERAKAYYYHACVYENAGDLERAVRSLIDASACEALSKDRYLNGLVNESFGRLHMEQLQLDEAERYYERALACYNDCGMKRNMALCRSKFAKIAALRCDDCRALSESQAAFNLFSEIGDTAMLLQTNGIIASLEFRQSRDPESVKKKLRSGYARYNEEGIPPSDMSLWCVLYINERNLDSARLVALNMLRDPTIETGKRASTLFLLKDIEKRAGNYRMATAYSERYIRCIDSVYREEQRNQIRKMERKYDNELLQARNEKLCQRNTYLVITGLLGFVLLLFAGGAVLRRRKRIIERQRRRLVHYSKFVESLKESYTDMQGRYEVLMRQQDHDDEVSARILISFKNRLEGLKYLIDNAYLYERKPAQFYEEFKKYVIINPNTQYAFSDIQYVVNKTCFGVIDYLKDNYPDLTAFDLDLCSLLCFGFSQNGIRTIYEHKNAYSIYNKRSKLRKKLGLQPGEQIEHFLHELKVRLEKRQRNGIE